MIGGPGLLSGLPIFVNPLALKETTERLFPESKHRSKRIRKKLVKRFGGEFRKVPTIWRTPAGIAAHPALYADLLASLPTRPAGMVALHDTSAAAAGRSSFSFMDPPL